MPSILVSFHTPSNAGYAMSPLEKMFFEVACKLFGGQHKVHFSFTDLSGGHPNSLPSDFINLIKIDRQTITHNECTSINKYIAEHNIQSALCFDLQVSSKFGALLRTSGVRKIVSYWGAPISGENSFLKLLYKRIEVGLNRNKPDLFIFESKAMQHLAIKGRGIPPGNTCVIPTGVNTDKFKPDSTAKDYLLQQFNIPKNSNIAFYSGHMEERKGVKVIVEAAIDLIENRNLKNWYFIFCGNRPGEEQEYVNMLKGKKTENNIIFAGYRTDINKIMPGCDIGVVASTGWDSFPMSCLEMAASGLPLIVSSLQGLTETIEEGVTGLAFQPGKSTELADMIYKLDKDEALRKNYSIAARRRITCHYRISDQENSLIKHLAEIFI